MTRVGHGTQFPRHGFSETAYALNGEQGTDFCEYLQSGTHDGRERGGVDSSPVLALMTAAVASNSETREIRMMN